MNLARRLADTAALLPHHVAVRAPDGDWTYGALHRESEHIARALLELGVAAGDRVGVWMEKSGRTIAVMQAVLRIGAAYVPLDPASPAARARAIMLDCDMRAVAVDAARPSPFGEDELQPACLGAAWGGTHLLWDDLPRVAGPGGCADTRPDDLAYILYTSGSTGRPKGVCISHKNARAFIDWATRELRPSREDRFSSHAPFHFDLSVLDLYVPFTVGASVSIVPEGMAYVPRQLVDFLCRESITVWYSVPSALILMMEHGELLEASPAFRTVLFAGEPFPIKHLRRLRERYPEVRLLNLYGPTETNVCTFHEVETIDPEQTRPVPLGRAASGDEVWAVRPDGQRAQPGEEGELFVFGPTVMLGYWGHPPQTGPYATGDVVRVLADGTFDYVGRRDHMVKVRGHRIELGEIEAALLQHDQVRQAAVVVTGAGVDARLSAFVEPEGAEPPLLVLKAHCASLVPKYMIIDEVTYLDELPLNRNGKIDRRALVARAKE